MTIYKPVIHFRSRHESGNIFAILASIRNALQRARRISEYNDLRDKVFDTHSYQEALSVMRETVVLIDDDGMF